MDECHVVIVGGGFSGAALAVQLARHSEAPLRITLLEPRDLPGHGVAYSTPEPAHRINVPAARMQLSESAEGDFDRWYRQQPAFEQDTAAGTPDGAVWPQRAWFGRYVHQRLMEAVDKPGVAFSHLREHAVAQEQNAVITASGQRLEADVVVLAVSHPPPALPASLQALADHPGVIANPWQTSRFDDIGITDRVAIIGTGLTMADVVASLGSRGHRGRVLAFSRRGLLPRANLSGTFPDWSAEYSVSEAISLRQWLARVRGDIRLAAEQGIPWQKVLDAVRHHGQDIWQSLPLREQQRFLRHLRSWWDVHRYRIAPQVAQEIAARRQRGELDVRAARLEAAEEQGEQLRLFLRQRGGSATELVVDRLVVTTGPAHGGLIDSQPLLRDLARHGIIQADALRLGLLVNQRSQTLNHAGEANPRLLVVGPAARGRFGELMGLPQVADHAHTVALEVLASLRQITASRCPVPQS
ncbi:FAD/NAD(P)-binding protein [Entomohabitans teleogrylli]|uniref:FAD/NAD(P)-binding protein n=1 Tax=Entomohabitans teleogrylli TaxID=1384589 RepID=UPI00073D5510|nr:FAD-dependent oxidoreductase [Entomohabitans teleogrylli]